jgi:hypothetical protein
MSAPAGRGVDAHDVREDGAVAGADQVSAREAGLVAGDLDVSHGRGYWRSPGRS